MALTTEQMQARLDALLEMRFSGVRETSFEGRRLVYASDQELAAAIASLEARLRAALRPRPRIARPYAVKDL
jgi:hypothetical protein